MIGGIGVKKRIAGLLLMVMLFAVPCLAEEAIPISFEGIDNADAFCAAYGVENTFISFDGYIEYYDDETVTVDAHQIIQDFIIHPGNYGEEPKNPLGFILRDTAEDPASVYDWDLEAGDNVHVTATVIQWVDYETVEIGQATIVERADPEVENAGSYADVLVNDASASESDSIDVDAAEDKALSVATYADFSIEIPGEYEEISYDPVRYGRYEKKDDAAYFETSLLIDRLYDESIDKIIKEYLSVSVSDWEADNVKSEVVDVNGIQVTLLTLPDDEESKREAFFSVNEHCYQITIHNLYELSAQDLADWEKVIGSIQPIIPEPTATPEPLDTSAYVLLEKGNKGDDVKTLQQRLIDLYYLDGKADGSYGNNTKAAVEKFQQAIKVEVTGIADPTTQAVLFSEDAPEATLSISSSSMVIGSNATTSWYVDGQEFTLKNSQTKTIKTVWGTYKFDAYGEYEKIEE